MRKLHVAWIVGVVALCGAGRVLANGGPFVIKYPDGDPAAKGVLARIDPDLKPAREERLRVVKEDLKIAFLRDPVEAMNSHSAEDPKRVKPLAAPLDRNPPMAMVSAIYTIENPTDAEIEVDFGFPILRGVYTHPYSMMPRPEVNVQFGDQQVQAEIISNSIIYGMIRQRSQEAIDKALAADPELAQLVEKVRATSYVRQRARETIGRLTERRPGLAKAVQADASLAPLLASQSEANDPDREAARQALLEYLTGRMKWSREPAVLMVEYASLDLGDKAGIIPHPYDAGRMGFWGPNLGEMSRLAYANLGRLSAIGEQKATQLFAELASRFDPTVKTAYEAIFTAWGGDVRERSVDFKSGQLRPREITINPQADKNALRELGFNDPTIYARVDYLDENNQWTEAEKTSCRAVLKNLPVVFTFAPMNLLHYRVKFPAKATKTLTVSYKQHAYADTREPASYQLAYVVHPASLWKEFGPIELEVAVPEGVAMRASTPCRKAGIEERELPRDFPGLPQATKARVAIHRATLAEKTGELFVALDAESWKKLTEKQPEALSINPPAPPSNVVKSK